MDSCPTDLKESELYADDQVILASSAEQLQDMVTSINEAFKRKGMNVNVNKAKVVVFERDEDVLLFEVKLLNDMIMEQVNEFVYLGSMFTSDGKVDADVAIYSFCLPPWEKSVSLCIYVYLSLRRNRFDSSTERS